MGFLRSACSAAFCGHEIRPASSALPQKSALQHHPAEKGCVPVLGEVERQKHMLVENGFELPFPRLQHQDLRRQFGHS